jgi:hypothetical protein
MANVIELPGEANPLTAQNLFNALVSAASSTQQQVHIGTQQLQHWEKQNGFYPLLQVSLGIPISTKRPINAYDICRRCSSIIRYP